ncbi:unnamed protein product [Porites evermanni]|uniref:LAGLIDADG endonuclease n=1 Tax=Porites evermanni TaxID=104178 RepID=A0ABN8NDU6_9CNID|nr:unnamed protein product [Porites evermanni]
MRDALIQHPVKRTSAAVCVVNESRKTLSVKKMEQFSRFHNFEYKADGLRVWKCYGIGDGKYIPYEMRYITNQRYHSNTLQEFNVAMLRSICNHFEIPVKSRDKKKFLLDKLTVMISECECVSLKQCKAFP